MCQIINESWKPLSTLEISTNTWMFLSHTLRSFLKCNEIINQQSFYADYITTIKVPTDKKQNHFSHRIHLLSSTNKIFLFRVTMQRTEKISAWTEKSITAPRLVLGKLETKINLSWKHRKEIRNIRVNGYLNASVTEKMLEPRLKLVDPILIGLIFPISFKI